MSEKLAPATMTEEAKNYRQKFDGRTNGELLSGVDDLVGDRFQVTKNDRLQNKAGAMAKDAAGNLRNVGGRFEHQSQLEDVAAYEDQIRLGMKAKEVVPALKLIDDAIASAWRRSRRAKTPGNVNETAVIRKHLVISKTMTAREVGNMSDEDITTLIDYARIAKAQAEAPSVKKSLPSVESLGVETDYERSPLPGIDTLGKDEAAFQPALPGFESLGELDPSDFEAPDEAEASPDTTHKRKKLPSVESLGEDTEATGPSPELEQKLADLEVARAKWAAISTKRQSRTFDRRIKGYNDAKNEYNLLVQELGRIQLHGEIEAAETPAKKNAITIAYLAEEQNKLRDLIRHETDNKFINKFSNWMNKGSRKARIAKGVLIGVAVGTGGSFLLGAAGAAGAAGLAVGASRFVRGYTMRNKAGIDQLDDRRKASAQYQANMQTMQADNPDQFAYTAGVFRDYFETDSKREQAKRRKAFAWGVGSIAVGAVAGHLIHAGIDSLSGHHGVVAAAKGTPTVSPSDHSGGPIVSHEPLPPVGHDFLNAPGVYDVHSGEGWYETFKDMGLPQDKWADVLNDAGPKLHEQGWAYFDNIHHEWRISHPGHLSNAAVQALKDASARHGFSFR